MTNNKLKIFITGGAGYVGEMLCDLFAQRDDVAEIIALDKDPQPEFSKKIPKLTYIQQNMADDSWQDIVAKHKPNIVIHTAWQIRPLYGHKDTQWHWNVDGSKKVFDFAFGTTSVEKLIYFSTASCYSARADNALHHRFSEQELFRDDDYLYAVEKKRTEEDLLGMHATAKKEGAHAPQVFIVRPAGITGPRGRFMRSRFGLQATLTGTLKKSLVHRILSACTAFVPATKNWVRQFIHEDDVANIVIKFATEQLPGDCNTYNIAPPGPAVFAEDMARVVHKRVVRIPPQLIRFAFWILWHLTRGRVPTSPGGWRYYSYSLLLDGTKITRETGYQYAFTSLAAFSSTEGRYESYVPEALRTKALEERNHA